MGQRQNPKLSAVHVATILNPISKAFLFSSLNFGIMSSMVASIICLSKTSAAAALRAHSIA
jgi:hypothetical protein